MTLHHVDMLFQLIVFLFAISFHESAHAWMANRCGDPTARMLGRISLNPVKHIDPIGTILMPVIAAVTGFPMIGWAKPTPVDPRNFKNPVKDDILTSVAGPISNFIVVIGALILLLGISLVSPVGQNLVRTMPLRYQLGLAGAYSESALFPATLFLYELMWINIVLGVFNLIPVPPLDGSHVLRHFLSESTRRIYDGLGWFALLALVYLGGGLLGKLIFPVIGFFNSILMRI